MRSFPDHSRADTDDRARLNVRWFIRLRWGAIAGQLILILLVHGLGYLILPIRPLIGLIVLAAATNAFASVRARAAHDVSERHIATLMVIDALILTGMLFLSGGPLNPFSTLYLVNVALGAVLLSPRWSWLQVAISLAGFASLFVMQPIAERLSLPLFEHAILMGLHLRGMWVAFAVAAVFIVYFVQRVTRALAERELALATARHLTARKEKIASLATLSTGAAHELASPLSTIAVVATDLDESVERGADPQELRADLQLIRSQVNRCQEILQQMAADAGHHAGEPMVAVTVAEWINEARDGLKDADRVTVVNLLKDGQVHGPRRALTRALRSLIKNALETCPQSAVTLAVEPTPEGVRLKIIDAGGGMSPETLAKVGEPFFTTKRPGEGMGLGIFLARSVFEQLGGSLELHSELGRGTEVTVQMPNATYGSVLHGRAD